MDNLAQTVEMARNGLIKASAVVQSQIPSIVHQLLKWEVTISILSLVIFPIILVVCIRAYRALTKEDPFPSAVLTASCLAGGIISLIVTILSLLNLLEIWIAPKVYLINYLRNLIVGCH